MPSVLVMIGCFFSVPIPFVFFPMMLTMSMQHTCFLPGVAIARNASKKEHSEGSQSSQTKSHIRRVEKEISHASASSNHQFHLSLPLEHASPPAMLLQCPHAPRNTTPLSSALAPMA